MSKKLKLENLEVKSFTTSPRDVRGGVVSVDCDPTFTGGNTLCTEVMCLTLVPECPNSATVSPSCGGWQGC
jgi:hypothetical protein